MDFRAPSVPRYSFNRHQANVLAIRNTNALPKPERVAESDSQYDFNVQRYPVPHPNPVAVCLGQPAADTIGDDFCLSITVRVDLTHEISGADALRHRVCLQQPVAELVDGSYTVAKQQPVAERQ